MEAMNETLEKTTAKYWQLATKINLERAVKSSQRMEGHYVLGHVDTVGRISLRKEQGAFIFFGFELSPEFDRYLIEKGSVAIDGISLTVNKCSPGRFEVAIIPHTAKHTTLSFKRVGDKVNIELDVLGKYIEKLLLAQKEKDGPGQKGSGLDLGFLARHGYI